MFSSTRSDSGGSVVSIACRPAGPRRNPRRRNAEVRFRNRTSAFRRLGFRLGPAGRQAIDTTLPPESLLVDENIKPGYFELQEETRENDAYRANQELRAAYAMADLPVLSCLRLTGGARVERSRQTVDAKS